MEMVMGLSLMGSAAVLCWIMGRGAGFRRAIDGLACAALIVFGTIAGSAVARTLVNDTVFMTEVHGVLLKEEFLAAGSYLGVYGAARLAYEVWRGKS